MISGMIHIVLLTAVLNITPPTIGEDVCVDTHSHKEYVVDVACLGVTTLLSTDRTYTEYCKRPVGPSFDEDEGVLRRKEPAPDLYASAAQQ